MTALVVEFPLTAGHITYQDAGLIQIGRQPFDINDWCENEIAQGKGG